MGFNAFTDDDSMKKETELDLGTSLRKVKGYKNLHNTKGSNLAFVSHVEPNVQPNISGNDMNAFSRQTLVISNSVRASPLDASQVFSVRVDSTPRGNTRS